MSHIGSGGAFKLMLAGTGGTGTAIGVGGAYKSVTEMWIGQGGVWKRFFPPGGIITVEESPDLNAFGFGNNFGSVAPSPFIFGGKEVVGASAGTPAAAYDFLVQITGSPTSDHFTSVTVEDGDGVERNYTSASATFTGGTVGTWQWGDALDPVYDSADINEQHPISFT